MKLAIWTNIPSPHQRDFYTALRTEGVDLCVRYFGQLSESRRSMGWAQPRVFPEGEAILTPGEDPLSTMPDFASRVHILTGYAYPTSRHLVRRLSVLGVPWAHWSEWSRPTIRSPLLWPLKRWYADKVNRFALGAFAQGELAAADFVKWGIHRDRIAPLCYSANYVANATPDRRTVELLQGREAIAFVGSLIPLKQPLQLIDAFAQAKGSRDTALLMVGDGPLRQACQQRAAKRRVANDVLLTGVASIDRIPHILACCHTLVLPSNYDGWGMVLNEGAASELALVASDKVGAAQSLIEPGVNGQVFQAGRTDSLARALSPYLADSRIARRHGARSIERLAEHTPSRNVRRCLSSIQSWLASNCKWDQWRQSHTIDVNPSTKDVGLQQWKTAS